MRPILIHPDPRLRRACAPAGPVDDGLRALIDDMLATMYDAPGVGLAAPQIGIDARIAVLDCSAKDEDPAPLVMVNPEIVWASEDELPHEEGCLSIPDVYAEVTRPARVRVRFLDRDGAEIEREFEGLWSVCAQHEIDHLNGKLFIDYLGAARRMLITNKMKKLKKERARARPV